MFAKISLLILLNAAAWAQASVCQHVQARIGEGKVFQNFLQNSDVVSLVQLTKTGAKEYTSLSGDQSGSFTLKDYGVLCLLKSTGENSYFPAGKALSLSVPNAKGECWVYMARISKIVPEGQEKDFIQNGFCVSPFSADPDTSWNGTSAMTPYRDS